MTTPAPARLFEALDRTWPAARYLACGPWCLRDGAGGGKRVSAATAKGEIAEADISEAEAGMRSLGQRPLFMLRPGEDALDAWLEARGYAVVDPVVLYGIRAAEIAEEHPPSTVIPSWPPLAMQTDIWSEGGIGPARIGVMERADRPKAAILGRSGDRAAATVFVAADDEIAMVHALETKGAYRRHGVGRRLMTGAGFWAETQGAEWLTLAVTRANVAANALYRSLGMGELTAYHYRVAPELPR